MCEKCKCNDKTIEMEELLEIKALLKESIILVSAPIRSEITDNYINKVEKILNKL